MKGFLFLSVFAIFSIPNLNYVTPMESNEIIERLPKNFKFPTQKELFKMNQNGIAGYPFKITYDLINEHCKDEACTTEPSSKYTPITKTVRCMLIKNSREYTFYLYKPYEMWTHTEFNKDEPLVIFVSGFSTNETKSAVDIVYEAYKCRGGVNFVAIDAAKYVINLNTWADFNSPLVGHLIASALEQLLETGYPIENIHLIGHSLGADIVGLAARILTTKTGFIVPRITGLDPANPCCYQEPGLTGLHMNDAEFVDVIHTNPGALGKLHPIGHVDFYVNGLNALQPGCVTMTCSHARAWEYYAESVYPGNEYNLWGTECKSLYEMGVECCTGPKRHMGYVLKNDVRGIFLAKVNSKSPFGEYDVYVKHKCA